MTEEYSEHESTFTHEDAEYDLNGVLEDVKNVPIVPFRVKDLEWVLEDTKIDDERLARVDLIYPVLVALTSEGKPAVVDGAHRLTKAVREQVDTLPGKWVRNEVLLNNKIAE